MYAYTIWSVARELTPFTTFKSARVDPIKLVCRQFYRANATQNLPFLPAAMTEAIASSLLSAPTHGGMARLSGPE